METNKDAASIRKILKAHEDDAEQNAPVGKKLKAVKPSMLYDEYIKTGNPMFKSAAAHSFKELFRK